MDSDICHSTHRSACTALCCNSHCYRTEWKEYGLNFVSVPSLPLPCQERRTSLKGIYRQQTAQRHFRDKLIYVSVLTQYCAGDKTEKNEMGGACGTYGGGERCAQGFGGET